MIHIDRAINTAVEMSSSQATAMSHAHFKDGVSHSRGPEPAAITHVHVFGHRHGDIARSLPNLLHGPAIPERHVFIPTNTGFD
jgi:hypothetical protein